MQIMQNQQRKGEENCSRRKGKRNGKKGGWKEGKGVDNKQGEKKGSREGKEAGMWPKGRGGEEKGGKEGRLDASLKAPLESLCASQIPTCAHCTRVQKC